MRAMMQARLAWLLTALFVLGGAWPVLPQEYSGARAPVPGPAPKPSGGSQAPRIRAPHRSRLSPGILAPPRPLSALAPAQLGTGIEGINFDQQASTSGYYEIPPDPNGAAGSNDLVSVVNSVIDSYTKSGTLLNRQRLGSNGTTATGSFFQALSPVNGLFDPKVIYDQYEGRFLVVALEQDSSAQTSRILLAVSAGDDPTGAWYFTALDSKLNIGGSTWADFPGLAVDDGAVYITANMFPFSGNKYKGTRLWIVNKLPFYTNGAPVVAVYDPYSIVGGGSGGTLQPAHVYGVGGVGPGAGTFLVSSGWTSGGDDLLEVIRVDSPTNSPSFTSQMIDVGQINNDSLTTWPDASQPGTTNLVSTGDIRPLQAVWRDNNLYVANTVVPRSGTDAGQATAHWYRIDTSNLSALALADQGDIGGEEIASGTYTFYPSIGVDSRGDIGIGFAASGPGVYPGAYYTGRETSDPAGTMEPALVLATGVDYYYRAFGGSENRWGDYSGIALDPSNESVFWLFNEYALTRGTVLSQYPTEDGRWGTHWGSFAFDVSISGTVAYYPTNYPASGLSSVRVANVTMNLTGDTNFTGLTASDGTYASSNLTPGDTYCVTPAKSDDSNPANGINGTDLVLIQRHLLALARLDSPYKLLAADVDGSGDINGTDLVLIQRLLLAYSNSFPAGLWRFVPADYVFPDPQNPWDAPSNIWTTNLLADAIGQDFVAVKLGDVDNSWTPPGGGQTLALQRAAAQVAGPGVMFHLDEQTAMAGQRVAVPVSVSTFRDVDNAQFTLEWSPAVLRYAGTESYGLRGMSADSFGTTQAKQGRLAFVWYDPDAVGATVPDGTRIFAVNFEVVGRPGSSTVLSLGDALTMREVGVNFREAAFDAQHGRLSVVEPLVLRFSGATPGSGPFHISVRTQSGHRYVLERTDSLSTSNWTALRVIEGDGAVKVLSDAGASPSARERFYRVRVE